jgi:signal transduction histidine kinase/CHASE3 domain sensor protein
MAVPTYFCLQRVLEASNQSARSNDIRSSANTVMAHISEGASCRSNYALYQKEADLRCFESAVQHAEQQITYVGQLASNNSAERKDLDAFDSAARTRIGELQQSTLLQRSNGYRPDQQFSLMQHGNGLQDQLRLQFDRLQTRERGMLANYADTLHSSVLKAFLMLTLGTAVSATVLCGAFFKFRREIRKRVSAQYFTRLAYAALEFAHRHLDGIIESTPDSVAAVDHQLNFIAINGKYKTEYKQRCGHEPEVGTSLQSASANGANQFAESSTLWLRALAGETFTVTEDFSGAGHDKTFLEVRYFPINDRLHVPIAACRIARDITEHKHFEDLLFRQSEELTRSNAELEQFAYVASHDLQEPLRMVSSYVQLLAEKYRGQLDEKADKFIGYAVDGAQRMQTLISDLLALSRVNSRPGNFKTVSSADVLKCVLHDLNPAIRESGAIVEYGELPVVTADAPQLTQLFQNLIANALKFRGDQPPHIKVQAERNADQWLFAVEDNGIGIAPEHSERIFMLFQRLHSRQEYSGTGIGLAICKKIVERHRGRIWVESEPGRGSAFKFSVPVSFNGKTNPCWQEAAIHA